ncbi:hypothetical protein D9M70_353610 [compost metagenome]
MALDITIGKSWTDVGNGRTIGTYRVPGGVAVQNYQDGTVTTQVELSYPEYAQFRDDFLAKFGVTLPNYLPPEIAETSNPNGNTQGRVIGETPATGKSADDSNGEVESETPAEDDTGDKILDGLQLGLDVVGLIPVVGEIADLANAGISLARGDYAGAALSLLSAIPFAGYLGTAGKVGRRGAKAAGEASAKATKEAAERTTKEAADKAAKEAADKAAKEAAQKQAKEDAARSQNSGGKSKKNNTKEKGDCGEWLSKMDMLDQGFDDVVAVQNNSGHGVDLIGRNSKTGEVKVWEVKTTDGPTAGSLSKPQREMGGQEFTKDRLARAASGAGNYGKLPQVRANATKATQWIRGAGEKVTYEKREVFIDDLDKGCMKHPTRKSKSKPW